MNRLVIIMLMVVFCFACFVRAGLAQDSSATSLTDIMTPEEYQSCGLDKLTYDEICNLNKWISSYILSVLLYLNSNEQTHDSSLSYSYLEGAVIIANDGQYLGRITTNPFDIDSIANKYGTYGSQYSSTSIHNEYCIYGSEYSSMSPFCKYASDPPWIFHGDEFMGYLTVNEYKSSAVNPFLLFAWLESES